MFTCFMARETLCSRFPPGTNGGGVAAISALLREAATNVQYNGKSAMTVVMTKTM